MSDSEEATEYDPASETSLDFNEEDGEFRAPHVLPQQLLIPSQQQPRLPPHLFYRSRLLHYQQAFQTSSVKALVPQNGKPQQQKTELEICALFGLLYMAGMMRALI